MKKSRWSILHEDEEIIIIDKPADWSSVPDRFDESKQNIYKSLSKHREKIFMVHRLDRETSGVMVLAKTEDAHKNLSQQFENRLVDKRYHAFIESAPFEEEFEVDAAIAYSSNSSGKVFISKTGKESLTKFKIILKWKSFSLLECMPKTGRTHQIRIHLQHAGLPLLVDSTYGTRKEFMISEIKQKKKFHLKKNTTERPLINRHTLHAFSLGFEHPSSKEKVSYQAEYPKDLRALQNQLSKWNSI